MRVRMQLELVKRYFNEFRSFRSRGESVYAVERLAQLVVQSLLDLGAMMAVHGAGRKPETYRGVAEYLARELGLSEDLKEFLKGLAGFRNILVHGYAEIDRGLEEEAFKAMEGGLPLILGRLESYVKELRADPGEVMEVAARLEGVFRKYGVRLAFLYGSRARLGEGRDYDIAVVADFRNALELGRLLVDIADALEVHEDCVDLVHLNTAPLNLVYTVVSDGRVIYGDEEEARNYLYRRYVELLDQWTYQHRLLK